MVYYISAEDLYLPNLFVWYAIQMDLYLMKIIRKMPIFLNEKIKFIWQHL